MAALDPAGRLVLGSWGLAGGTGPGSGYAEIGAGVADAVLREAWSLGIRMIDHASVYGDGEAMRRIAAWQERTGHRFAPVLKPGRPLVQGHPSTRLDYDQIRAEIDQAVAMLGSPAAILIKDPPQEVLLGEALGELWRGLSADFPAALIGVATHRIEACGSLVPFGRSEYGSHRSRNMRGKVVVQLEYNGVNWPLAAPAVDHLHASGARVWAMQPLAYGFLGRRNDRSRFAPTDFRARLPIGVRRSLRQAADDFVAGLRLRYPSTSRAVLALSFCLSNDGIERVVVGPKSPGQVADVAMALELAGRDDFRAAADALRSNGDLQAGEEGWRT